MVEYSIWRLVYFPIVGSLETELYIGPPKGATRGGS